MSRRERRATAAGSAPADAPAAAPDPGVPLTRRELRDARHSGRRRRRRRRSRYPWLDRLLLAAIVVVCVALGGVYASFGYASYRFDQVKKVSVPHLQPTAPGQPFNVLVIGSDSRAGLTPQEAEHYGTTSNAGGQRSDVVKIVHVVPATGQITVLSIPRDTMVQVAGDTSQTGTYNRINATYATGPDQLVQTIEANFGIPIEHTVQVDFNGLIGAVDAVGGVWLDFPYPARDDYTGLDITTPGCQLVNGGYALAVARSRHYQYEEDGEWLYDGTSDFGRIQRQNAFLKALIDQAETKYSPLTLNAFIGSVVQGVTIDDTFTLADLVKLAGEFHAFDSNALGTFTLPTYSEASDVFSSLGAVQYVQQPAAQAVITQFLGSAPFPASTPPPDPSGAPTVVPSTTTTTTLPGTSTTGGTTPATVAPDVTTTTIETDFDPTPCSPPS